MSEIEDGGAAFPSEYYAEQGMTLRDYFAAAALQGLVTNNGTDTPDGLLATWSYSLADAMLAARKEEA
jgi:hypothetical protein